MWRHQHNGKFWIDAHVRYFCHVDLFASKCKIYSIEIDHQELRASWHLLLCQGRHLRKILVELGKHRNSRWKSKFGQKSNFWSKIEIWPKVELLVKNRNLAKKNFWSKIEIWQKVEHLIKNQNLAKNRTLDKNRNLAKSRTLDQKSIFGQKSNFWSKFDQKLIKFP